MSVAAAGADLHPRGARVDVVVAVAAVDQRGGAVPVLVEADAVGAGAEDDLGRPQVEHTTAVGPSVAQIESESRR